MTSAETIRAFKKHFKRWTYMIKHYGWKLTVCYCDGADEMPAEATLEANAYTETNFKYLDAFVYVNVRKNCSLSDSEIEYVVIHELTHLLVSPLQESNEITPLEYTVTSIARILQGLRNGR